MTSNGRVSITRRRFRVRQGGGQAPVDSLLDVAEASVSLAARELCSRLSADARSFARAADNLKHAAQVTLSTELLRQVVEQEGKRALSAADSGELSPRWQAADCQVHTPEGKQVSRVYLGVDGFMAPTQTDQEKSKRRKKVVAKRRRRSKGKPKLKPLASRKKGTDQRYKEFKLVQFHSEEMDHRLVSVTRKDCQEAGRIMRRDAGRLGFDKAQERLALIDGSVWIVNQIMRYCLLLTAMGLDFYHLSEHVNQAKRATFGEENQAGDDWAGKVLHQAKHDGYEPMWEELVQWRSEQKSKARRAEADGLLHYMAQRKEMIQYDLFLEKGWRLSSSTTESQCGTVPQRVKGSGKRWDPDNAEAVMALECLHQSHQWQEYWTTCAWQTG